MRILLDLLRQLPSAQAALAELSANCTPATIMMGLRSPHGAAVLATLVDDEAFGALPLARQAQLLANSSAGDGIAELLEAEQVPAALIAPLFRAARGQHPSPEVGGLVREGLVSMESPFVRRWATALESAADAHAAGDEDPMRRLEGDGVVEFFARQRHLAPEPVVRALLTTARNGATVSYRLRAARSIGGMDAPLSEPLALALLAPDRFAAGRDDVIASRRHQLTQSGPSGSRWTEEAIQALLDRDLEAFDREVRNARVLALRLATPRTEAVIQAFLAGRTMPGGSGALTLDDARHLFGEDPKLLAAALEVVLPSHFPVRGRITPDEWADFWHHLPAATMKALAPTFLPVLATKLRRMTPADIQRYVHHQFIRNERGEVVSTPIWPADAADLIPQFVELHAAAHQDFLARKVSRTQRTTDTSPTPAEMPTGTHTETPTRTPEVAHADLDSDSPRRRESLPPSRRNSAGRAR